MKEGQYRINVPVSEDWMELYSRLTYGFATDKSVSLVPQPGHVDIMGTPEDHVNVYEACLDYADEMGLDPGQITGDIPEGYRPFRFRFTPNASKKFDALLGHLREGSGPFEPVEGLRHITFSGPGDFTYYGTEDGYRRIYRIFFEWCVAEGSDAYSGIEVETRWPTKKGSGVPELPSLSPEDALNEEYQASIEPVPAYLRPVICHELMCEAMEEVRQFRKLFRRLGHIGKPQRPPTTEFMLHPENGSPAEMSEGLSGHLNAGKPYHMKVELVFRPPGLIKERRSTGACFTGTPDTIRSDFMGLVNKIERKERKGRRIAEKKPTRGRKRL